VHSTLPKSNFLRQRLDDYGKSEVLQICLLLLHYRFLEIRWTAIHHYSSLTRSINIKNVNYTCIVQVFTLHWLCSLYLPACDGLPFRAAPQSGLRTEEGCRHCLHRKETVLFPFCCCCEAGPSVQLTKNLHLADLCLLLGFRFGNTLYFWHCLNYFILAYKKHSQNPTCYLIKKKLKRTRHLIHIRKEKDSVPGCESRTVSPAADAIAGCICLPCRAAKEDMKLNLSF